MSAAPSTRRSKFAAPVLVAAIAFAAYLPLRSNGFVDLDDRVHIVESAVVAGPLGADTVRGAFGLGQQYWQPLTMLSLAVDRALFGLDPRAFHLENLLWHVGAAIALLLILADLTGERGRAAAVAAIFAVHPVNVESVAWAIERRNVLAAFFGVLAVGAYVRWVRRPTFARHLLLLALLALSLLSKALLITFPLLALALDVWPLRRVENWRRALLEKIPMTAVCAVVVVIVTVSLGRIYTWIDRPLALRAANAAVAIVRHLVHLVAPVGLAPFYPYPEHVPAWHVAAAVLLLGGITGAALWAARARASAYWLFGWCWFVAALLPTLGLRQMGMWPALADRHAYVAAIGPIVAVVWGVADLLGARARSLAVAVVVGLAALTARQVRVWKDNVSLFARAVEGAPEIALFRYMLGTALATATPPREAEAIPHLQEAIRLEPSRGQARANLGRALAAVGRDEEAEATLRAGLALAPQDEAVGEALGELLLGKLRNAEAAVVLERAVAADPANARAQGLLGEALNREGRFAETIARGEALPGSVRAAPDVRFSIGVAYASTGRIADARAELTQLRAAAPALAANLESYLELVPAQGATAPRGR